MSDVSENWVVSVVRLGSFLLIALIATVCVGLMTYFAGAFAREQNPEMKRADAYFAAMFLVGALVSVIVGRVKYLNARASD